MRYAAFIAFLIGAFAFAHKNHNHKASTVPVQSEILESINAAYVKEVKPIFARACFDCHSSATRYPWYSDFPIAKRLIRQDIAEAKEHLDLSEDFPFKGHGSPKEDLEAIRESIEKNEMPPFRYLALHWSAKLKESEKRLILRWIENSVKLLP